MECLENILVDLEGVLVGLEGVSKARGIISEHINTNPEVRNIILDGNNTISEDIGDCLVFIEGIPGGFEAIPRGYNTIREVFKGQVARSRMKIFRHMVSQCSRKLCSITLRTTDGLVVLRI